MIKRWDSRAVSLGAVLAFLASAFGPMPSQADDFVLPRPGTMVALSHPFNPPILKGLKVHPDNPFRFDFILDRGDNAIPGPSQAVPVSPHVIPAQAGIQDQQNLKTEATKLIKYFLASLTIPESDLWVNLSPYEKDRIIPEFFGRTEMGRDLLAEDYILKQITASLIYPEKETGRRFWKEVYAKAAKRFGTTNIPVKTFNKVWIVPAKAVVYENARAATAYVVEAKLKVMLEEDYLSTSKHQSQPGTDTDSWRKMRQESVSVPIRGQAAKPLNAKSTGLTNLSTNILREIVIPELTKEVNEGRNFAQLRQVYNSLVLATWYKKKIKDSILSAVYEDKDKVTGLTNVISASSTNAIAAQAGIQSITVESIYHRYLRAFKKGVYNYIREEIDPATQQPVPRKYFSGGMDLAMRGALNFSGNGQLLPASDHMEIVGVLVRPEKRPDAAMTVAGKDNRQELAEYIEGQGLPLDQFAADYDRLLGFFNTAGGKAVPQNRSGIAKRIEHFNHWLDELVEFLSKYKLPLRVDITSQEIADHFGISKSSVNNKFAAKGVYSRNSPSQEAIILREWAQKLAAEKRNNLGIMARSELSGIRSIKGTILDPDNPRAVWEDFSPAQVRLKPDVHLDINAILEITKITPDDFGKVFRLLQQAQNLVYPGTFDDIIEKVGIRSLNRSYISRILGPVGLKTSRAMEKERAKALEEWAQHHHGLKLGHPIEYYRSKNQWDLSTKTFITILARNQVYTPGMRERTAAEIAVSSGNKPDLSAERRALDDRAIIESEIVRIFSVPSSAYRTDFERLKAEFNPALLKSRAAGKESRPLATSYLEHVLGYAYRMYGASLISTIRAIKIKIRPHVMMRIFNFLKNSKGATRRGVLNAAGLRSDDIFPELKFLKDLRLIEFIDGLSSLTFFAQERKAGLTELLQRVGPGLTDRDLDHLKTEIEKIPTDAAMRTVEDLRREYRAMLLENQYRPNSLHALSTMSNKIRSAVQKWKMEGKQGELEQLYANFFIYELPETQKKYWLPKHDPSLPENFRPVGRFKTNSQDLYGKLSDFLLKKPGPQRVIAISGFSGSGKSAMAERIRKFFETPGSKRQAAVLVLHTDDYQGRRGGIDRQRLTDNVKDFLAGKQIIVPQSDQSTNKVQEEKFDSARLNILILEGTEALSTQALRSAVSKNGLKVVLAVSAEKRLRVRLKRDIEKRGRAEIEVLNDFALQELQEGPEMERQLNDADVIASQQGGLYDVYVRKNAAMKARSRVEVKPLQFEKGPLNSAVKGGNDRNGGIDLTPDHINLETRNGGSIRLHIDPAMLQQLKDVPGFMPVIINIRPMRSLQVFLGLEKNNVSGEARPLGHFPAFYQNAS